LSIADFQVGAWYYGLPLNGKNSKLPESTAALKADLDNFPNLTAYLKRFHEEFKDYL
jgi:hypothetical protein